jgi:hypothetical protein
MSNLPQELEERIEHLANQLDEVFQDVLDLSIYNEVDKLDRADFFAISKLIRQAREKLGEIWTRP